MISSIIREFTKEEKEQLAEEQRPEVKAVIIAKKLKQKGYPDKKISDITGLSSDEIRRL